MRIGIRSCWTLPILFTLLSAVGCQEEKDVNRCFYYWRSSFALSADERLALKANNINTLYIKYFDIVSDERFAIPTPTATLSVADSAIRKLSIIPTIYITTNAVKQLNNSNEVKLLASLICRRVQQVDSVWRIGKHTELQIDCDWTASTKDTYFELLNALKKEDFMKGKQLSATIRLHQIKYNKEAGVPPADKGMLMCYNLSDVRSISNSNSIFEANEAASYVEQSASYPIRLDVALPIFSWSVVFSQNRFRILINGLTSDDLSKNHSFVKQSHNRFRVIAKTTISGVTFYPNDLVRTEDANPKEVLKFVKKLKLANRTTNVSLFTLDKKYLKNIDNEEVEALFGAIR